MLRDNQPRGYSQRWAMRTASKHTCVLQLGLTTLNVESRDKCLFLIARDLVRDIRTLQRKA